MTKEHILDGQAPGLGESTVRFMEEHGLNCVVIAKGRLTPPYVEISLGGQIAPSVIGTSDQNTVTWATAIAQIDPDKCKGCFECIWVCPEEVISVRTIAGQNKSGQIAVIDLKNCKGCGLCSSVCPPKFSAIVMLGAESEAGQALVARALRGDNEDNS
jgi:Pyruvate/2-oxoacid:ferredoxin oxidoreductase delta subunit